ncbi:peptidoglycan glycosyltransferase [Candidatus Omnitrophus magneticus]|uniref:Peptidoglycan glycosyltransferase n=1 Tax=Candidatus Omnitrophus magneticus TaxID=1609969 RepID=A0A0F0CWV6_9BACT|nr:peptidoglycan glycosyltransferase [Candidatus Omnitrophus magneticus]
MYKIETRIEIYIRVLAVIFFFLITGLFYTQIIKYNFYKRLSEGNHLRIMPLRSARGTIYDKNCKIIVKDILSFNVSIVYKRVTNFKALTVVLSNVFNLPQTKIEETLNKCKKSPYFPVTIIKGADIKKVIQFEEVLSNYPGIEIEVTPLREYPSDNTASGIIGFLGLINREEFTKLKHYGYIIDDFMGRAGIEKYYDNYLRGSHGGKETEIDNRGRETRILGYQEPVSGKDIYLTIDADLQKFCDNLMNGSNGSIIVMEPSTGAILAMSSAPDFFPGVFTDDTKKSSVLGLLKDKESPLLNRAISGAYPPGSIFKLVVASMALEKKRITPNTTVVCGGTFQVGKHTFHCWNKDGHGPQNISDAIKNSCNIFFYRIGFSSDVDEIADYAKKFGFGNITNIDLPSESKGVLPTRKWKLARWKDNWYKGETVNYAIGQGYLMVTPIQVARMMSGFANRGYMVKPYIVSKIGNTSVKKEMKTEIGVSKNTLDIVINGMKRCINEEGGTGAIAKQKNFIVAGKTGTAQNSKKRNHGWFAGFMPVDKPKILVVVFDEYGARGGHYAAGVAGEIFKEAIRLEIVK